MTHKSSDELKQDDMNPLRKFTTQEILDELVKRDGVSSVTTKRDDYYWITVSGEDGIPDDPLRGIGEATIIVVRKQE